MMKEDNESGWQSEKNQEDAGRLEAGALQPACFWISGGCGLRPCMRGGAARSSEQACQPGLDAVRVGACAPPIQSLAYPRHSAH